MRRRIIVAALLGVVFCGISCIVFLLSDTLPAFVLGLLILFPGFIGGCSAFFLTFVHILRRSIRKTEIHLQFTQENQHVIQLGKRIRIVRTNRAGSVKNLQPMIWPLVMLIILIAMSEILPNLAEPFIRSLHFGIFVAFPLLVFSFFALLYGILAEDALLNQSNERRSKL